VGCLGKLVPLAWNHTDEVIGHIDPATATVKDGEVIANGWVDQSIARGEEAWRLVKSGTLSFSFGFLFEPKTGATKLPNGRYRVKELDIYEISTIPVGPANNDTRVLSFKAMTAGQMAERMRAMADEMASDSPPAAKEMATRMRAMAMEMAGAGKSAAEALDEQAKRVAGGRGGQGAPRGRSVDPLRKQAEAVALEFASDGQSLRKPPKTVEQPKPSRAVGLGAQAADARRDAGFLSGGTTVNRYEKQKLAVEKAMSEQVASYQAIYKKADDETTATRPTRSASKSSRT
jgi:hypothetical protein